MLSGNSSFKDVVSYLIGIIDLAVPVLIALILVLFMWAGVRYVSRAGGGESKSAERDALLWGVIALFVVFSVWGLVRILCNTFLGSSCG